MTNLEQFKNQQYLTIETYRRNGEGVKTPVWFAQDGEALRVWTQVDAGKVKRIRRDGRVQIVPSTASGEALGEWKEASAVLLDQPQELEYTIRLFRQKYGLMFNLFGLLGRIRKARYITIHVQAA